MKHNTQADKINRPINCRLASIGSFVLRILVNAATDKSVISTCTTEITYSALNGEKLFTIAINSGYPGVRFQT